MIEPAKFYSPEVQAAAAKIWMPRQPNWDRVLDTLEQQADLGEPVGLDSEFYNVDIKKQSCAFRSKIHVFSVAWLTDKVSPRGHRRARGAVLPVEAINYPRMHAWLSSDAWKVLSNSPVDAHSFSNMGVEVGGMENTLSLYRWMVPGQRKYGLDEATIMLLGRRPFCTYKELVTEEYEHTRFTQRKTKVCECGEAGCRKRSSMFHERREVFVDTPHKSIKTREIPLEEIVPGHRRHPALVLYAADDAIASVEERDNLEQKDRKIPYPWLKTV